MPLCYFSIVSSLTLIVLRGRLIRNRLKHQIIISKKTALLLLLTLQPKSLDKERQAYRHSPIAPITYNMHSPIAPITYNIKSLGGWLGIRKDSTIIITRKRQGAYQQTCYLPSDPFYGKAMTITRKKGSKIELSPPGKASFKSHV